MNREENLCRQNQFLAFFATRILETDNFRLRITFPSHFDVHPLLI